MSVPANALSDEECLHYAALDPASAAELTRRLTAQCIDSSAELNELREELSSSESAHEDTHERLDCCLGEMYQAADQIRLALMHLAMRKN